MPNSVRGNQAYSVFRSLVEAKRVAKKNNETDPDCRYVVKQIKDKWIFYIEVFDKKTRDLLGTL